MTVSGRHDSDALPSGILRRARPRCERILTARLSRPIWCSRSEIKFPNDYDSIRRFVSLGASRKCGFLAINIWLASLPMSPILYLVARVVCQPICEHS